MGLGFVGLEFVGINTSLFSNIRLMNVSQVATGLHGTGEKLTMLFLPWCTAPCLPNLVA